MAFRFWRRIRLAPGISLNLSKTGMSMSLGPRGAKYTFGTRGQRATVGIPGSGLFYTKKLGGRSRSRSSSSAGETASASQVRERLSPGFFKRLVTPRHERDLVDGLKAYSANAMDEAFTLFNKHLDQPDSAFMAGIVAIALKRWDEAIIALKSALAGADQLGSQMTKYGISIAIKLKIRDGVETELPAGKIAARLALVEVWQTTEAYQEAADMLMKLREEVPNDVVVKLSLAELLMTLEPEHREHAKLVNAMAGGIENESEVHTALMLYQGKALRVLGLHSAAREVLTAALRKPKDRDEGLLREIRYIRALVYEELDQAKRARSEFEIIYADDPDFEDVARRLGMES